MLLLIDNFDSFTLNIAHAFQALGIKVVVKENCFTLSQWIRDHTPKYIVLGPGPGRPTNIPFLNSQFKTPTLGICLGHQAIAYTFGSTIRKSYAGPKHGKQELITHKGQGIFSGLPSPLPVGRYHSLSVEESSLPKELTVTSKAQDGEIMGLQHSSLPIYSVQFHPESILSEGCELIFKNFITF